jgi:hypothetical protein
MLDIRMKLGERFLDGLRIGWYPHTFGRGGLCPIPLGGIGLGAIRLGRIALRGVNLGRTAFDAPASEVSAETEASAFCQSLISLPRWRS